MERVPNWSDDGDWPCVAFVRAIRSKEVADFLGVHPRTVQRWMQAYREGGMRGLKAKPAPGRPPTLSVEQERHGLAVVPQVAAGVRLSHGTVDGGPRGRTDPAQVPQEVPSALHQSSGWPSGGSRRRSRSDRPANATQREVRRWLREEWPTDKKSARRRRAHLVLIDESGFLMSPLVRRTLAPRGHTPILKTKGSASREGVDNGGLTISPQAASPGALLADLSAKIT